MSSPNEASKPALIPAVTTQSGEYAFTTEDGAFSWSYAYDIHASGTKSERRIGKLAVKGFKLGAANPGDCIQTPWGLMQRTKDTVYEQGFLLEHTLGQPIDPRQGKRLDVPERALERGGSWKAVVGPWRYGVRASAMGSRSERRIGNLRYAGAELSGRKEGDYVEAPWGTLRWMGPIQPRPGAADYEQGFLLRGTYDRPLDNLTGDSLFPTLEDAVLNLESMYLDNGLQLGEGERTAHSVSLMLKAEPGQEAFSGTLMLDPNTCSLNDFGDRAGCTRMAVSSFQVRVTRMRLGDPLKLGRRFYEVKGEGVPEGMALIALREFERSYLKLGRQLVPLSMDDGF